MSRTRVAGTTANPHASDGHTSGQDGPSARTKLLQRELPVERDQGLVTGIRQRTDRPLQQPAGNGGPLEGGLDIRSHARHKTHGPGNASADNWSGVWRQALGGSGGLSFMR